MKKVVCPILAVVVFLGTAFAADDNVSDLEKVQKIYQDQIQKIDKQHEASMKAIPDSYMQNLGALEKFLQGKGDLKGVVAVRKETDRYKLANEISEESLVDIPEALRNLQRRYIAMPVEKEATRKDQLTALTNSYLSRLASIQKSLTIQGKIDEALLVNSEIETIKKAASATDTGAVVLPAQPVVPEKPAPVKLAEPLAPPTPVKDNQPLTSMKDVEAGDMQFRYSDLVKYKTLRVNTAALSEVPKTKLVNHSVGEDTTFTVAASPYHIVGSLLIQKGITLIIEPGTKIYFDDEAGINCEGSLETLGEGTWIVFAPYRKSKWSGIDCSGRMRANSCLFVGASSGVCDNWSSENERKSGIELSDCIFYQNKRAVAMMGRPGKVSNSLFLKNDVAMMGLCNHARLPAVVKRCLFIGNKGSLQNNNGQFTVTESTFYDNDGPLSVGKGHIGQCNVFVKVKPMVMGGGNGKVDAQNNYWGPGVAEKLKSGSNKYFSGEVTFQNWGEKPFEDSMPTIPKCLYLK